MDERACAHRAILATQSLEFAGDRGQHLDSAGEYCCLARDSSAGWQASFPTTVSPARHWHVGANGYGCSVRRHNGVLSLDGSKRPQAAPVVWTCIAYLFHLS